MKFVPNFLRVALLSLPLIFGQVGYAQSKSSSGGNNPYDTRNTVGVILISGLVGGVLGLSTLSFYQRPQDHIRNITLGAGLGIIASALFMTAAVATTPPSTVGDWKVYPLVSPTNLYALAFDLKF